MKKIIAILILVAMLCLMGCNDTTNATNDNIPNDNIQNDDTKKEEQKDDSHLIKVKVTSTEYYGIRGVEQELGCTIIVGRTASSEERRNGTTYIMYTFTIDTTYAYVINDHVMAVGFGNYRIISNEEYEDIQKYQIETGRQVIYPTVYYKDRPTEEINSYNANIYYVTNDPDLRILYPEFDENGKFVPNYWKYEEGNRPSLAAEYNSLRIEGENGFVGEDGKTYLYAYGRRVDAGVVEVRANLYEYQAYRDYVLGSSNEN